MVGQGGTNWDTVPEITVSAVRDHSIQQAGGKRVKYSVPIFYNHSEVFAGEYAWAFLWWKY